MPAYNEADTIVDVVNALGSIGPISNILVVNDGSSDSTGSLASSAGASVLDNPRNLGKGHSVKRALEKVEADVLLLVDGDTGRSAGEVKKLLQPILDGEADMTIGVFPKRNGRGGFGIAKGFAAWSAERMTGRRLAEPLSGQRAFRAELLSAMRLDPGYGLETGMNIDVLRAGANVVEVSVDMTHAHTGRSFAGFAHRGKQLIAIFMATARRIFR